MTRRLRYILMTGSAAVGLLLGGFGVWILWGDGVLSFEMKIPVRHIAQVVFYFDETGHGTVSVDGLPVALSPAPTQDELNDFWCLKDVSHGDIRVIMPANFPVGSLNIDPGWFMPIGVLPRSMTFVLYRRLRRQVAIRYFSNGPCVVRPDGEPLTLVSSGYGMWGDAPMTDIRTALRKLEVDRETPEYLWIALRPDDTTSTMMEAFRQTDVPGIRSVYFWRRNAENEESPDGSFAAGFSSRRRVSGAREKSYDTEPVLPEIKRPAPRPEPVVR